MQTGPRPSSSPSSFPADTSLLFRALSVPTEAEQEADERGRQRHRKHRWSISSSIASRLSPTIESASEERDDDFDDESDDHGVDIDAFSDSSSQRRRSHGSHRRRASQHRDEEDERVPSIQLDESQIDPTAKTNNMIVAALPNPAPLSEATPLLLTSPMTNADIPRKDAPDWRIAARQELAVLIAYTIPIVGTHVLEFSLMMITVISTSLFFCFCKMRSD